MDLSHARVVFRERGTTDVLDLALSFCVSNARHYARVAAAALLPAVVVSWAVARSAGWAWGWTSALALSVLAEAPFTVLASRLVFEPEARLSGVLVASLRALPRVLALRLAQLVLVSVGLLILFVPGLWVGVSLLFVAEVAILERAPVGGSIARSLRLTSYRSSEAVAGALSILVLGALAIVFGDDVGRTILGSVLQFRAPESMWTSGGSTLALLGFWLFVPFAATARFFVYLDLRTRSEGWDIQTRFLALALRAQEERKAAA